MRIFDNTNQLMRRVISRRLQTLDAEADCNPYKHVNTDPEAGQIGKTTYYVGVDSTLTESQIAGCLGPMTAADTKAEADAKEQAAWLATAKAEVDALKTQKADKSIVAATNLTIEARLAALERDVKAIKEPKP